MINSKYSNLPPVVVIGSGGHAKVLIDCLQSIGREILFCTELDSNLHGKQVLGVFIRGNDDLILELNPDEIQLVNGMGSVGIPSRRKEVYQRHLEKGFSFASVIHPSATVATSVQIDEGVQIMAGAVVQTGARIRCNSIINTGACIDHDCRIGPHCHVAPAVVLSGGVVVNECTHIGTGACVIQGINIGRQCIVGAGATVIANLDNQTTAVGTPAKPLPSNNS